MAYGFSRFRFRYTPGRSGFKSIAYARCGSANFGCSLFIARRDGVPLTEIFTRLPKRYSRAALIKQFPRTLGLEIVKCFSLSDEAIQAVAFLSNDKTVFMDENNKEIAVTALQKKP